MARGSIDGLQRQVVRCIYPCNRAAKDLTELHLECESALSRHSSLAADRVRLSSVLEEF